MANMLPLILFSPRPDIFNQSQSFLLLPSVVVQEAASAQCSGQPLETGLESVSEMQVHCLL